MDSRPIRILRAAVEHVQASRDTSHALAEELYEPLLEAVQQWDGGEDADASRVLGLFCFYRYLAAPQDAKPLNDLRLTVMALTPCLLFTDMALPSDLLPMLGDHAECEAEQLRRQARDLADPVAAERAAWAWESIVAVTGEDHPRRGDRLRSLLRSRRLLAALRGDTAELDQAVTAARHGLAGRGRPERAGTLWALQKAFEERYEATGSEADHQAALDCAEELASYAPKGEPIGQELTFAYGEKLLERFLRAPNTSDLLRAITCLRESTAGRGPERPTRLLALAEALSFAYYAARDATVLNEAIAHTEQADALVDRAHPDHPRIQTMLGKLYLCRYQEAHRGDDLERAGAALAEAQMCLPRDDGLPLLVSTVERAKFQATGDTQYLYNALMTGERAERRTPENSTARPEVLRNLSRVQRDWYRRSGTVEDLDRAIANGHAAVDLLTDDDHRRPGFLLSLGSIYITRANCRGEHRALFQAVELYRQAATPSPEGHVAWAALAQILVDAYELTHDPAALDEAVTIGRRALPEASENNRPKILLSLAKAHWYRHVGTGAMSDRQQAWADLHEALRTPGPDPDVAMLLRLQQAEMASAAGQAAETFAAFEAVVELLPAAGLRSRLLEDHEFELTARHGAGARAAAAAVAVGRPDRALELLEQARGILADSVRGIADSDAAPTAQELCRKAARGPIVTLSATDEGLALLVTPQGVQALRLAELSEAKAYEQHERLQSALQAVNDPATATKARGEIREVLAWLWQAIARPVLDALAATGWTGDRLWWCPAGVFSLLPLHAAGDERDSVMARAVSSYTPTLRALPSEGRPAPTPLRASLAIAMSKTPGGQSLPGAASELFSVRSLLGANHLQNHQATRDAVLSALTGHRIVHFACHAQADLRVPSSSRLLLHDRPLTSRDLMPLRLDADLAYLSACATSTSHPFSADEALHITAAFHLAGFRNVIGTLWMVDDDCSADIAHDFYTRLAAHGPDHAAYALHSAVSALRQRHPDKPDLWAAHLHVGP
ncbi:CHAT domain-containing protein [Spirillospora sp. NPDC050679]